MSTTSSWGSDEIYYEIIRQIKNIIFTRYRDQSTHPYILYYVITTARVTSSIYTTNLNINEPDSQSAKSTEEDVLSSRVCTQCFSY